MKNMREFASRNPSGMEDDIDLNQIVRNSTNLLSNKLKKSTNRLSVEYGEGVPRVRGNSQRIEQVIINLVLNAAEALPDPEKALSIRTFYDRKREKIMLEVQDEGIGIEPGNLRRIFDPFFTTKRSAGGTGLGLAISMSIAKSYGGDIQIDSRPGRGHEGHPRAPRTGGAKHLEEEQ